MKKIKVAVGLCAWRGPARRHESAAVISALSPHLPAPADGDGHVNVSRCRGDAISYPGAPGAEVAQGATASSVARAAAVHGPLVGTVAQSRYPGAVATDRSSVPWKLCGLSSPLLRAGRQLQGQSLETSRFGRRLGRRLRLHGCPHISRGHSYIISGSVLQRSALASSEPAHCRATISSKSPPQRRCPVYSPKGRASRDSP